MTSEGLTPDEDLLGKIPSIDEKIISICDLIPISTWGLSADDHEELRKRKHRIVNQHLTPKEKRTLTNSEKQQVASAVGGICRRCFGSFRSTQ
ncbi:hypothetical protein KIN20_003144 [Parelaphostrongylus tenuis]|uniref:Uncharacterized protein n=1 Tax=Parelaphostrongylus tenuis TaxID=148309 RepID=A0AAD5LWV5_PARTN|nr:hypothetical protein KIN20_003144 [Parelaphostrongylus tenuis]